MNVHYPPDVLILLTPQEKRYELLKKPYESLPYVLVFLLLNGCIYIFIYTQVNISKTYQLDDNKDVRIEVELVFASL